MIVGLHGNIRQLVALQRTADGSLRRSLFFNLCTAGYSSVLPSEGELLAIRLNPCYCTGLSGAAPPFAARYASVERTSTAGWTAGPLGVGRPKTRDFQPFQTGSMCCGKYRLGFLEASREILGAPAESSPVATSPPDKAAHHYHPSGPRQRTLVRHPAAYYAQLARPALSAVSF